MVHEFVIQRPYDRRQGSTKRESEQGQASRTGARRSYNGNWSWANDEQMGNRQWVIGNGQAHSAAVRARRPVERPGSALWKE